jgi:predicted DNA-binding protein (MmcQ/YjbR family)
MARPRHLTNAESALRQYALTYPESHEDFPWGHCAIKVKGKVFLILSHGREDEGEVVLNLTVKLPESGRWALTLPYTEPTGYGLGKSGWVSASFGAKDEVPLDILEQWVDESFRAVAPKRVLAKMQRVSEEPTTEAQRTQRKAQRFPKKSRRSSL